MNKKQFLKVMGILIFLSLLPMIAAESINVDISITPSESSGFDTIITSPDGDTFSGTDSVPIEIIASYNLTDTVTCEILIDNTVIEQITINDGNQKQVTTVITLDEGTHTAQGTCSDNQGNTKTSSSKMFNLDLGKPQITLVTSDGETSESDSIPLQYIVTDTIQGSFDCTLEVFDQTNSLIDSKSATNIANGATTTVTINNLIGGTYAWNVACTDSVGNLENSETRAFTIDQSNGFSISLDKESYNLGETVVLVINANQGDQVTLLISPPNTNSLLYDYSGTFPKVHFYDVNKSGPYTIKAFKTEDGELKEVVKEFTVDTTLTGSININETTYGVNETIKFNAKGNGGLGDLTFTWDFDDDTTTETGKEVTHKFTREGTYDVNLTISDEYGNELTKEKLIRIVQSHQVTVTVENEISGAKVNDATVVLDDETIKTGSNGQAVFYVNEGEYDLTVLADNYRSYSDNDINVDKSRSLTIELEPEEGVNITEEIVPVEEEIVEEEVVEVKDFEPLQPEHDTINEALDNIENAQRVQGLLDAENQAIAQAIDLEGALYTAKAEIGKLFWDLEHLAENQENFEDEELTAQRTEIMNQLAAIQAEAIKSVSIVETHEFEGSPEKKEIENISYSLMFLAHKNDKKEQKKFLGYNKKIQSEFVLVNKANIVSLEYLDGENKQVTIVTHVVDSVDELSDKVIAATFGSEIETIENIEILSSHKEAVDQIMSFGARNQAIYLIDRILEEEEIENIKVMISADPENYDSETMKGGNLLTGFATFGGGPMIENPIIFLEILVIVGLIIAYLFYEFNVIRRIKEYLGKNDTKIVPFNNKVQEIKIEIGNKRVEEASKKYEELNFIYKALPPKSRAKLQAEVKDVYMHITVAKINGLVQKAKEAIKGNELERAQTDYEEIQELYKQLPVQYKASIMEKCKTVCTELTNLIQEANQGKTENLGQSN